MQFHNINGTDRNTCDAKIQVFCSYNQKTLGLSLKPGTSGRLLSSVSGAALFVVCGGFFLPLHAQQFPSNTSAVGDTVTNYVTGNVATVTELQNDNAPDDSVLAWVVGVDDSDPQNTPYYWLVKSIGEVFYNAAGVAITVDSLDPATNDGTVTYTGDSNSYDFTPGLTADEWAAAFNENGTNGAVIPPIDDNSPTGVRQILTGTYGSDGNAGALFVPATAGGDGEDGPDQTQTLTADIDARATENIGWEIGSVGGNGGDGGNVYLDIWDAEDGGDGGAGGDVVATQDAGSTILTSGDEDGDVGNDGIFAYSKSGEAGDGGTGWGGDGGGTGGHSSDGGSVTVNQNGTIITTGTNSEGVFALSFSNNGGNGGDQWGLVGAAGDATIGGSGGTVTVTTTGTISTSGDFSNAVLAQSVGGSGGSAGSSGDLLFSLSQDNADNGGDGGTVTVTNSGSLTTTGDYSTGIMAQSLGGGGGTGGTDVGAVVLTLGGVGSTGGGGGEVAVTNEGDGVVSTSGIQSDGVFAQSVGGSGNTGTTEYGIVSLGGSSSGSVGGDGDIVTVSNYGIITTDEDDSRGIFAQSIGGGGGDGGNADAIILAIGGSGGAGGSGGQVTVKNDGVISTSGDDSAGIVAQSVGMGGGNGSNSTTVGLFAGVSIGGSASGGGDGGNASVTLTDDDDSQSSSITTRGDRSQGVNLQSVGGGGGNGGGAVSVTVGFVGDAAISVGGSGDGAGVGGHVALNGSGDVSVVTGGDDSDALFLQSVGGGGGNGGYAVGVAVAAGPASGSFGVAVGGSGGAGGAGGLVQVGTIDATTDELTDSGFSGTIITLGDRSNGMTLQSVGKGGGNGGVAVAATAGASALFSGSISVGVGGSGAGGGVGGDVRAYTDPSIKTEGDNSIGVLAQSVGGGGGNGGGSVAAGIDISSVGTAGISVGVGGAGSDAASGGLVDLIVDGDQVVTLGDYASGIVAQSIGGGGGNGGFSVGAGVDLSGAGAGSVNVAVGGTAGGGGDGGQVTLSTSSEVQTSGTDSTAILVQSVGMGGGNGGFAVSAGEATAAEGAGTISVGIGGGGASGGDGDAVVATVKNSVRTTDDRSGGVLAQSIGGGGGNGGFDVTGSVSVGGTGSGSIGVGLGGNSGDGGEGGTVNATVNGAITTKGDASSGFVAQSIGGGGGNGGFNVTPTMAFSGEGSGAVSVGLGGSGGDGGDGEHVTATSSNRIVTEGDQSVGVLAQSVGYGGGNGGFNVSVALTGAGTGSGAIGVGIGGAGGGGGDGGKVTLTMTDDRSADEIAALAAIDDDADFTVLTSGDQSSAAIAQSVGGGGGNGGVNVTVTGAAAGEGSGTVGVGIGGRGSGGGAGGVVESDVSANLKTTGAESTGLMVQSVGMGGGNGGVNVSASISATAIGAAGGVSVGIGGAAGSGGLGDDVTSDLTGDVTTAGETSPGVVVQSLGGGGGNGGVNVSGTVSLAGLDGSGGVSVGIGGSGGDGGNSGTASGSVTGDVSTEGDTSPGIMVQSSAGGGGNGGVDVSAAVSLSSEGSGGIGVGIGGSGGGGGDADEASYTVVGNVSTLGATSPGITIQSLGGGGGNGGVNVTAALSLSAQSSGAIGVGIGGSGGDGGNSAAANGEVTGDVSTEGDNSHGVMVQSMAGGGGNGGVNVTGALSLGGNGSGAAGIGVGGFGGEGGTSSGVIATYSGLTTTTGDKSGGVIAQSLGGGGGNGGTNVSGAISLGSDFSGALGIGVGGFGGGGGDAGTVDHSVSGYVSTEGDKSIGVMSQSLGGGGGNGGVDVNTSLTLTRSQSASLSIGVGGFGSDGGASDDVKTDFTGGVATRGYRSGAIVTQSLGGAGGTGGTNISSALNLSMESGGALGIGVGGFAGGGGNAGAVVGTVETTDDNPTITTVEAESIAVLAQSAGGGGGSGGVDVASSVNITGKSGAAISLGIGGFGGDGGDSDDVSLDVTGLVGTMGNKSHGIVAQSSAGSGGVGGVNIASSLSFTKPSGSDTILSIAAGVGGFGGGGGTSGNVDLSFDGTVQAIPMIEDDGTLVVDTDSVATGIIAQSVGGGGGHGGVNVSDGISISAKPGAGQTDASKSYAVVVGVGGFGGTGGDSGEVSVDIAEGSKIYSYGSGQSGILAQSVGGGGGDGGLNVSGGIVSDSSLIVGVGGMGGNAGAASDVTVRAGADIQSLTNPADVEEPDTDTFEDALLDLVGQEVFDTIEDTAEQKGLKTLMTELGIFDDDTPETDGAAGLLAQSVGGGGGNGGLNVSGGVALTRDGKIPSITFGIGGFGGDANVSGDVDVDHAGEITVAGNWKHGIQAQSIAGGGGHGGLNVTGQLNWSSSNSTNGLSDLSIVGGVGGNGGEGADSGDVVVVSDGDISTTGYHSRGIFAQSVGGSGGTGGINVTAVGVKNSSPIEFGVGGSGEGGGLAGNVTVTRGTAAAAAGTISTDGTGAHGIEASSIGGGGGDAGVNAVFGVNKQDAADSSSGTTSTRKTPVNSGVDAETITNYNRVLDEFESREAGNSSTDSAGSYSAIVTVGGNGGNAGNAGDTTVDHYGDISTLGGTSYGVLAQSVGGGGGNSAFNFGMMYQSGNEATTKGLSLGIGGGGGDGGTGGQVDLGNTGDVSTTGDDSHGIFAQSVGGGGGNAGYNLLSNSADGGTFSLVIGRSGGTGGEAGAVTASSDGIVATAGDRSHGLFAQSVANGGGNSTTTSLRISAPADADTKGSYFQLGVGLDGGVGGVAGDVDVTATGKLTTAGSDSHGVFAQSVGGGGGTGGGVTNSASTAMSFSIGVGGTGGEGGTSGTVDVDSTADIQTASDRSIGILAQSLGGGGGVGGFVKSGTSILDSIKSVVKGSNVGTTVSIDVGGSGGEGMTSEVVTVDSSGDIDTAGESSHGIFAQSVGGGGGISGVVENNMINLRGSIGNSANLSVGGDGGDSAASAAVIVDNRGGITTTGTKSAGIFAQSVGDGGGDAEHVSNIVLGTSAENSSSNAILIGGDGGTGGTGGDSTVLNHSNGSIITSGDQSHGIFAQSVGGGGGSGSDVVSVQLSTPTSGSTQQRGITIGVGGSGGDGGTGGDASVSNLGSIVTSGTKAHGVIAQSLGGGGGFGGSSLLGAASIKSGTESDPSIGLSLGGSGGDGNAAGIASVVNSGAIAVSGENSYGIYAQSVGGGGGDGGLAIAFSGNGIADRAKGQSWTQIAIGGAGGDGADAGAVLVENSGTISATGDNSYGVFAQSVGGGGGNAGYSFSSPVVTVGDYLFSHVLGAREGSDGEGGDVTVESTGDIVTAGANSQAMFSQSVNGGGGTVDTFADFSDIDDSASTVSPNAGTNANTGVVAAALSANEVPSVQGDVALGSASSDGNNGANVIASHEGVLVTTGKQSVAMQSQSIGGGGGQSFSEFKVNEYAAVDLGITMGAVDSDSSSGGNVTIERFGDVMTTGDMAAAGSVQSIGGGGGRNVTNVLATTDGGLETEALDASATLTLGADPSFDNDGGTLALNFEGATATTGDAAPGLVLQSIGGGGGEAYLTGFTDVIVQLGGADASTGSGGDIDVTNVGAVTTSGDGSDGIVLQSIGGGGGYVLTDLSASDVTNQMRASNEGDGGAIDLEQEGVVAVSGAGAVGILAQSLGGGGGVVDDLFRGTAGGDGAGGTVNVTSSGNILATGSEGIAVLAQSLGETGADAISVALDGVIRGGSGNNARAVSLDGGSANAVRLSNQSFAFAANDLPVSGTYGDDNINSFGSVVGNVDLGDGNNMFRNRAPGLLVTHDRVDLGDAGVLQNSGHLVPGGAVVLPGGNVPLTRANIRVTQNVVTTTALTGSIEMADTSRLDVDVSFLTTGAAGDGSDLIDATGSATIDGEVVPFLLSYERALPLTIIATGGDAIDNGALVRDSSAAITYSLGTSGSVQLIATPDYVLPGMTANEAALGQYFNDILNGQGSAELGPLFTYTGNLTSAKEVADVLSRFSTQGFGANQVATLFSGLRFSDAIRNCDRRRPDNLEFQTGDCAWFTGEGSRFQQNAYSDFHDLNFDSYFVMGGVERRLDGEWTVGLGAGYERVDLTSGPAFSSDSHRGYLGAYAERSYGSITLGGSLSGSFGKFTNERDSGIYETLNDGSLLSIDKAESDQDVTVVNLGFNAAYNYVDARQRFYLTPSLGAAATYIRTGDANESGEGGYGFAVEESDDWVLSLSAAVEMGGNFRSGNSLVQPFARAGFTVFNKDSLDVNARFLGASISDGDFTNNVGFDKTYGFVDLGVAMEYPKSNSILQLSYQGIFSENSRQHGGSITYKIQF